MKSQLFRKGRKANSKDNEELRGRQGGRDLSNGRTASYKCKSEGNTASHVWSINEAEFLSLHQLLLQLVRGLSLGVAGSATCYDGFHLGLHLQIRPMSRQFVTDF